MIWASGGGNEGCAHGRLRLFCPVCDRSGAGGGRLSRAGRWRLRRPRFQVRLRRNAAVAQTALPDDRHATARRVRRRAQRGDDPPRHRRHRRRVSLADLRRRAVRRRPGPRRDEVLHHPARRHRPREVEQAERRHARAVSAIHVRRHGPRAAHDAHRRPEGEPPPPRARHVDGRHALLGVGEMYPDFVDGLVPLASAPTQIAGRNRLMRTMIMDSIRNDPAWKNGDYAEQPHAGMVGAVNLLMMMTSSPIGWHKSGPTRDAADAWYENQLKSRIAANDANDMLYQFNSSRDYDPSPTLEKITARLLAINSADDVVNPPELGIMEKLMPRVKRGRYIL